MDRMSFLFAAYTAVWVLLFVYINILSRRNRRMEEEIGELRDLLQQREGHAPSPHAGAGGRD